MPATKTRVQRTLAVDKPRHLVVMHTNDDRDRILTCNKCLTHQYISSFFKLMSVKTFI